MRPLVAALDTRTQNYVVLAPNDLTERCTCRAPKQLALEQHMNPPSFVAPVLAFRAAQAKQRRSKSVSGSAACDT
jgi:hypothetical protein